MKGVQGDWGEEEEEDGEEGVEAYKRSGIEWIWVWMRLWVQVRFAVNSRVTGALVGLFESAVKRIG